MVSAYTVQGLPEDISEISLFSKFWLDIIAVKYLLISNNV